MSLPREEILKELELLPVWRRRVRATDAAIAITPQAAEASAPAESTLEPAAMPAVVEIPTEPIALADALPAQETEIAAPPSFRKAEIADMDWNTLEAAAKACVACSLATTRIQSVFGVGDRNAEWLFVGEAPGAEEDRRGEPFVGQAGKLLDNMLAAVSLKRGENVYIANVLKCRPPENRDPHGEEVVKCDPFLKRQVELIKPRLIVAMGRFAAQSLLDTDSAIGALRGKLHDYNGVPVIVTYHPAYLLRNLNDKAKAWEDLCYARRTMRDLQSQSANQST